MKRIYVLIAIVAIIGSTACSKKVDKPANQMPEQIYFDVVAVDNDGTVTQGQTVTVKINP